MSKCGLLFVVLKLQLHVISAVAASAAAASAGGEVGGVRSAGFPALQQRGEGQREGDLASEEKDISYATFKRHPLGETVQLRGGVMMP
jgi:hypothetical protein